MASACSAPKVRPDTVLNKSSQRVKCSGVKPFSAACFNIGLPLNRPSCGLKAALAAAQSAFYRELETYTLSDIITEKSTLEMLLSQTRER